MPLIARGRYVVDIDRHGRIEDRVGIADAADVEDLGRWRDARLGDEEAGDLPRQIARGDGVMRRDIARSDDAERDRGGLQAAFAPRGGNDDIAHAAGRTVLRRGVGGSIVSGQRGLRAQRRTGQQQGRQQGLASGKTGRGNIGHYGKTLTAFYVAVVLGGPFGGLNRVLWRSFRDIYKWTDRLTNIL
jgi:hypothetical protein